LRLLSHLN
jgi:hypothetical protein